jgi:hypothetical protein
VGVRSQSHKIIRELEVDNIPECIRMMSGWSRIWRLLIVVPLATLLAGADLYWLRGTPTLSPQAPRLLVLVVFDQLRGDYLERWQPLFGTGGFRRLQTEGAWFTNCHYPYAITVTAAGHASLLTGCSPQRHGIVGNDWYERDGPVPVYCVASDRYQQVPARVVGEKKTLGSVSGVSPQRLLVPTVSDVLKEASGGKSRVVSLSFKDRSAVLPAGHHPDACYWFDGTGRFVTSSYYRDRPHAWVAAFNAEQPGQRWFGKKWERLRPDLDYERYSGPDDVPGEGKGFGQGRVFPHPFGGTPERPDRSYYEALYNSPFGNEMLLDLTKRAIESENLGHGPAPDLLCVSFSCNDPIGHCYGPDSQEVLDVTLRSDRIMRDLLAFLDERVGPDRYLLALTADHGVCPLPEVSRTHGIAAERLGTALLTAEADEFLTKTIGAKKTPTRWVETTQGPWMLLNRQALRDSGWSPGAAADSLAQWLRRQPGVFKAYTRAQLSRPASGDADLERMQRSFYPERCGDVVVLPKAYSLFVPPFSTGTTHGTPHAYDTHVPLLVYGPSIHGGARDEAVTPQAIAAVFAHFLGLASPPSAEAPVPDSLLR